jgi:hypothetical protein
MPISGQYDSAEQLACVKRTRPKASVGLLLAIIFCPAAAVAGESHAGNSVIPVLLHVVACKSDLLHCRDVHVTDSVFDDMPTCRDQLLPAQAEAKRAVSTMAVVFARCRYSPGPARRVLRRAKGAGPADGIVTTDRRMAVTPLEAPVGGWPRRLRSEPHP